MRVLPRTDNRWAVGAALAILLAAPACRRSGGDERAAAAGAACDSARAAHVALDSVARVDRFRSQVYRYQRDSAGVRIVTSPAPGSLFVDRMAVVRVDRACRITDLVQTDSA